MSVDIDKLPSLQNIMELARKRERQAYVELEAKKKGYLRAGSGGMMSSTGEVAGGCVRKAHLRSLGVELDPPTPDKLQMFSLGYASEDIVYKNLMGGLPEGYMILREEEIPLDWITKNGTKVGGRPDMVVCRVQHPPKTSKSVGSGVAPPGGEKDVVLSVGPDEQIEPVLGLELKSVHSLWTARDVVFKRKPKLANLVQAAHYMWKLGVPYKLVYSSYSQLGQGMAGNEWISKLFPRPGEPNSEFVEHSTKTSKDRKTGLMKTVTTIKHIKQFEIYYDLRFNPEGILQYKLESESNRKWTDTIVKREDIERFYEFTSTIPKTGALGPRPTAVDSLGEQAGYSDCDYCVLSEVCDKSEDKGYEKWLKAVKKSVADAAKVQDK